MWWEVGGVIRDTALEKSHKLGCKGIVNGSFA
jgi:hypothetical protein